MENEYPEKWLILAREAFTLIRNLSNTRRGRVLTSDEAAERLVIIGDLSDALENLPTKPNQTFPSELVQERFREFVKENPKLKRYFSSCRRLN